MERSKSSPLCFTYFLSESDRERRKKKEEERRKKKKGGKRDDSFVSIVSSRAFNACALLLSLPDL